MDMTFLSVGRLTEQKNYPVIIDAFNKLHCTDVKYLIVGKGEDEQALKQRSISSYINFLGTMDRKSVLSYTAGADMVCAIAMGRAFHLYDGSILSWPSNDVVRYTEFSGGCWGEKT